MIGGEKLWEEKGTLIGASVKSTGPEGMHFEQTFTTEVKGFGRVKNGTNVGTLTVFMAPNGVMSGTGHGYCTNEDGDTVIWKHAFTGKVEGTKGKSVGILQFWTSSPKLSWMNNLIVIEEGSTDTKTMEIGGTGYEWK